MHFPAGISPLSGTVRFSVLCSTRRSSRGGSRPFSPGLRPAMAAIAPASSTELLALIGRSGILPPDRVKALPGPDALPRDVPQAAKELVQKGFLTRFQATQLLIGRHKGFRIG